MFNPHMHKMGSQGPKHYVFGDHFSSKNARKLRFYVYLHFNARKHRHYHFIWCGLNSHEIVNLLQFSLINNWNKIHNFLWIRSTSGKMMSCFVTWNRRNTWIWASCYSSKSSSQKYTAWAPGDPTPSCFGNVMSLFEEIYKVSEPNCYT